ncbi:MAG: imidazole glycerol phosphate synthase subunit HisH [Microthrixaceae bacterium]|nr:imidazole glycerol phosphate synthase subunit HisH [Microthrixaceae bacterium]
MTTAVVDLGIGNMGSVANMLAKLGATVDLTSDPARVGNATRIVLPGVGNFDTATRRLMERDLVGVLNDSAAGSTPILGICLGMQLLAESSEEGCSAGLGWIPGSVRRLPTEGPSGKVTVPHMGWSHLRVLREHRIVADTNAESRFYFVHSYVFEPTDPGDVVAVAGHQGIEFAAVVARRT